MLLQTICQALRLPKRVHDALQGHVNTRPAPTKSHQEQRRGDIGGNRACRQARFYVGDEPTDQSSTWRPFSNPGQYRPTFDGSALCSPEPHTRASGNAMVGRYIGSYNRHCESLSGIGHYSLPQVILHDGTRLVSQETYKRYQEECGMRADDLKVLLQEENTT